MNVIRKFLNYNFVQIEYKPNPDDDLSESSGIRGLFVKLYNAANKWNVVKQILDEISIENAGVTSDVMMKSDLIIIRVFASKLRVRLRNHHNEKKKLFPNPQPDSLKDMFITETSGMLECIDSFARAVDRNSNEQDTVKLGDEMFRRFDEFMHEEHRLELLIDDQIDGHDVVQQQIDELREEIQTLHRWLQKLDPQPN